MQTLIVSTPCFKEGGLIPVEYTGHGADRSPELALNGLCEQAVSIAVVMNDMGHPIPAYNHWVIWNIPVCAVIPGDIPHGKRVELLDGAVQGIGYGKNRYKGPKPPFGWSHIYHYNVFVLDSFLQLPASAKKRDLSTAMQGHILQQAVLTGHYK